ncbi:hypothetical protein ACG7TL_007713 [Trametes sanguinea]
MSQQGRPASRTSSTHSSRSHQTQATHPSRPLRASSSQSSSSTRPNLRVPPPPPPIDYDAIRFSQFSDPAAPDRLWFAGDFMLGAGMVIIQPSTEKIVLLSEAYTLPEQPQQEQPLGHQNRQHRRQQPQPQPRVYRSWFLPKGRKDVGESLEQAALREAYEESGYRVSFLPLLMPTNAPLPPEQREVGYHLPSSEPLFVDMLRWARRRSSQSDPGGEYLVFWYVGQIPDDAVVETGTRMPDEQGYETHLVTLEQAEQLLRGGLRRIVRMAVDLWRHTQAVMRQRVYHQLMEELGVQLTDLNMGPALALVADPVDYGPYYEELALREQQRERESREAGPARPA